MGRYRVNVECSQKLPQTKSEYFTHCSYEVQAISKGVAKAMVEDKARAEHGGCHDAGRAAAGVDAGSSGEHAVRQTGRRPGAGGQLDERPRGTVKEDKDEKQD